METYILVSFWMFILAFLLKVFITAFSAYPRKQELNIGMDIAEMVVKIPFFLWAAYLLWA